MSSTGVLNNQNEKPVVVVVAFPAPGHSNSCVQISQHLATRGFEVYFVGGSDFSPAITQSGAKFVENPWDHDHEKIEGREGLQGPDLLIFDFKRVFLDSIPTAFGVFRSCLETVREKYPTREVVIIQESTSMAMLPLILGAPLPRGYDKLPKTITFHATFNLMESKDVFPVGPGLPPPTTEAGRGEVLAMNAGTRALFKPVCDYANAILKPLGATQDLDDMFKTIMTAGNVTVLQYSPSLDYPRSDLHPQLHFIGLMPLRPLSSTFDPPAWLEELKTNAKLPLDSPDRKKVLMVSQGTVETDINSLLLPALKAFGNRPDFRVIAILGSRGKKTPGTLEGYTSTTVVDYFPYDAGLPVTDVFVTNAGFGAFAHGVMNAVPMVMCGLTQEKPEVCARAEMAGLAVNLRTQSPSVENLIEAVEKILGNHSYKERAIELKRENEDLNSLGKIEQIIWGLVEKQKNNGGNR